MSSEQAQGRDAVIDANGAALAIDSDARKKQEEEWKEELLKTEEEVATLRQVLASKQKHVADLKKQLGISVVSELQQDVREGLKSISESDVVQKTNQAFKTVGESFSTIGKKLGDVRNSATFKTFEEKIGGAYENVKAKVTRKKSDATAPEPMGQGEPAEQPEEKVS